MIVLIIGSNIANATTFSIHAERRPVEKTAANRLILGVVPTLDSIQYVKRFASPLLPIATARINPPIIKKMIGFANPITALLKLSIPNKGCKNSSIKEVTARTCASLAHIITAKAKRAIAA
jgi:hypothetical protein